MQYFSTRGNAPLASFEDVVLGGLAPDGGLYLPTELPHYQPEEWEALRALPYAELAARIMQPFVGDSLNEQELQTLTTRAYGSFRHRAIAPLSQIGTDHWLMELYHGPTLAFKDIALQFLGQLFNHLLEKRQQDMVVLGATSGDTGSAALAGCAGLSRLKSVILFPDGKVSEVQRRQMTTLDNANIHPIAINGTFDDCQHIVKTLFMDASLRAQVKLAAVNSINWARILAQMVYYIYTALRLGAPMQAVNFVVPSGNFGNIYAGWLAYRMGLPVGKLVIASNKNDILVRTCHTGEYRKNGVSPTLSPSMDIEISSNFERLLYDLYTDSKPVVQAMEALKHHGSFTLEPLALRQFNARFAAASADDAQTLHTMQHHWHNSGIMLDPHTATGVYAAEQLDLQGSSVILATAHPAKFPDAVKQATGQHPALPDHLASLMHQKERFIQMDNSAEAVKAFVLGL